MILVNELAQNWELKKILAQFIGLGRAYPGPKASSTNPRTKEKMQQTNKQNGWYASKKQSEQT